jgi:hypothetical protein
MKIDINSLVGSTNLLETLGYDVFRGKKLYDIATHSIPAFGKYSGRSIQKQMLHAFTEYALDRSLSNLHGLSLKNEGNKRSYWFLEITGTKFSMTTSLVKNKDSVPRMARYRCTRAMRNQGLLFPEQEILPEGLPYLIFVHGLTITEIEGQERIEELFCGIGMPNAEAPTKWDDFLSLDEYIQPIPKAPEEEINEKDLDALLKIKREFMNDGR